MFSYFPFSKNEGLFLGKGEVIRISMREGGRRGQAWVVHELFCFSLSSNMWYMFKSWGHSTGCHFGSSCSAWAQSGRSENCSKFFSHPPLPKFMGIEVISATYVLGVWTGFWCFWSDLNMIDLPVQTLAAHRPNAWTALAWRKKEFRPFCWSCLLVLPIF